MTEIGLEHESRISQHECELCHPMLDTDPNLYNHFDELRTRKSRLKILTEVEVLYYWPYV